MSNVITSWSELERMLQTEMRDSLSEALNESFKDLHEYIDFFYNSPEGRYKRTGQLAESLEQELNGSGNSLTGTLRLDTDYRYIPSGRNTETIYGYATDDGLLGNGGFWQATMIDIEDNIDRTFGKRFNKLK